MYDPRNDFTTGTWYGGNPNQNMNPYGMGNGGFGQYQPQQQMQGADQGNARIDKLKGRVSNLQEQMKGAGTQDMAGIQARMDKMQGRIKGLRQDRRQGEGMYGQPQGGAQPEPAMMQRHEVPMPWGGGMNFGGMQGGASQFYGQRPQGYGGMQQGFGMNPMQYGGMQGGGMYGGGMGGMGEGAFRGGYGMNPFGRMGGGNVSEYNTSMGQPDVWGGGGGAKYGGGYNPNQNQTGATPYGGQMPGGPQGAQRPGMQYRQDRRQARQGEAGPGAPNPGAQPVAPQQGGGWNPGTTPTSMGNMFDTGWGRLVASSTGNQNVMQLENDPSRLFHYDPNAQNGPGAKNGWKSMTPDEYRSYGDVNYNDPRAFGAAASPMMQQWTQKNGMWQGMQGSGAYA